MFICKKAEFEVEGISFALPKDMYLDMTNSDVVLDGFYLISPDASFEMEISYYNSKYDAHDSLAHLVSKDVGYTLIGEIQKVSYGGLSGYMCCYYNSNTTNEEYAFDIENGKQYNSMNVFITSKKDGKSSNEKLKRKVVLELLESIKKI